MKSQLNKTTHEREREGAKFYFYSSLVFAIFFAGGCFAAAHERAPHDDWFPVIFFAAMAGVCAFCALVLGAVLYFLRED